jgi:hypothetical protein
MKTEERQEILNLLDLERQTVLYPGVTRFADGEVVRDVSADGKSGEIVYSSCAEDDVDRVIEHQIQAARSERYELEWKVYGHNRPRCLGQRLTAAGFEAGAQEAFLVFRAGHEALDRFGVCHSDIRRVTSREDLRDYQVVREEVCGKGCEGEIEQYGFMLEQHPNTMSVYVAYVGGEPAACGRIYFHQSSRFAGLYGGNTRERFRRRGLFTQMVAVRIREALHRGVANVCVDALPTSEPILRKHGFERVTHTQPFCFFG